MLLKMFLFLNNILKKINRYSIIIVFALTILLPSYFLMFIKGNINVSGIILMFFFVLLAVGFSGYKSLKGFMFTIMIFAGVAAALYYPRYLVQIGNFKLTPLIIPLINSVTSLLTNILSA
mgnify:CR=1 FL=1